MIYWNQEFANDVVALPTTPPRRIQPIRIAARRQKEKMVIWRSRLQDEHVDWFDNEEVEEQDETTDSTVIHDFLPLIDIDQYMEQVWEDESPN